MSISLRDDGVHVDAYQALRPFASFLPGIAGEYGKPMWVFYTNRGQCISSFGVRDKNGAMLEFHPANKAYALTSLLGFRTFFKVAGASAPLLYEPFQPGAADGRGAAPVHPRRRDRDRGDPRGARAAYARRLLHLAEREPAGAGAAASRSRTSAAVPLRADVLDGLPQIVPYGLEEKLLEADVAHDGGVCRDPPCRRRPAVLQAQGRAVGQARGAVDRGRLLRLHGAAEASRCRCMADPDLVFGTDTSLRTPLAFLRGARIDPLAARRETLTGCAFAQLPLALEPGASSGWDSYFGQVPDWEIAQAFRAARRR